MFLNKYFAFALILTIFSIDKTKGQYVPECYEQGECTDSLITDLLHDIQDVNACLEYCKSNSDCQFFTYFEEDNSCLNLVNCINFSTDSCINCYSGQKNCEELQCWIQGQCNGLLISVSDDVSENDCLDECQATENCSWFTHDSDGGLCELLEDCQTMDTSCDTCLSSQVLCSEYEPVEPGPGYTKLIVIGGFNDDLYLSSVEVIDLENSNAICNPITDYPVQEGAMAVGIIDGLVKSCGGIHDTTDCYDYNPTTNSWITSASMSNAISRPRASFIDGIWLVSGGTTSEMWTGNSFEPGPSLPIEMYGHCQLTINSTHIFFSDPSETMNSYLLNWPEQTWTMLPLMTIKRGVPSCGLINNPENGLEAVIVEDGTSEIFNIGTLTWRTGPSLESFDNAGFTQLTDTFVVVGGNQNDVSGSGIDELNTIYLFDHINYDWILASQRLQTHRDVVPGVVAVPDDFVSCS